MIIHVIELLVIDRTKEEGIARIFSDVVAVGNLPFPEERKQ